MYDNKAGSQSRSTKRESSQSKQGSQLPLLPPQSAQKSGKKILVLDLDETLVHSQFKPIDNPDIVINIDISNMPNQVMN